MTPIEQIAGAALIGLVVFLAACAWIATRERL